MAKSFSQVSRLFSTAKLLRAVESKAASAGEHGDYKLWKRISLIVCLPVIGLAMVNTYLDHKNHPHERPPFVAYEYLRIRNKKFPWGDGNHSLFHNPHVNALPDGYEETH